MNGYEIRTMNEEILRLYFKKPSTGAVNRRNVEVLGNLKTYIHKCVSLKCLFFSFAKVFDLKMLFPLFYSMKKTEVYMYCLKDKLKNTSISVEELNAINYFFKSFDKRVDYLKLIIEENLKETKYYPFYRDLHISIIDDFGGSFKDDAIQNYIDYFSDTYLKYCETHQKEIEEYLPIANELVAQKEAFRDKKSAETASLKEAEKLKKANENKEIAYMKKEREKERDRDRKFNEHYGIIDKIRYIIRLDDSTYWCKGNIPGSKKSDAMKFTSEKTCKRKKTWLINRGYNVSVEKITI